MATASESHITIERFRTSNLSYCCRRRTKWCRTRSDFIRWTIRRVNFMDLEGYTNHS